METNKKPISPYLKQYIQLSFVSMMRQFFTMFLLILPLLFIIMPALQQPRENIYSYILIPSYACLLFLGAWIALSPYEKKRQVLSMLFIGLIGVFNSLGFLLIAEKMAYEWLQITSPFFFLFTVGGYLVLILIMFRWYLQAFRKEVTPGGKGTPKGIALSLAFAVGGTIFAKATMAGTSQNGILIVMIGLYLILSLIFMLFTVYIHKYIMIRKYIDHVTFVENPTKKKRKIK
jgi:hypothetical protein